VNSPQPTHQQRKKQKKAEHSIAHLPILILVKQDPHYKHSHKGNVRQKGEKKNTHTKEKQKEIGIPEVLYHLEVSF
jgi:hypothetical protein